MKRIFFLWQLIGLVAYATAVHANTTKEYFVKAAFVYNFTKFVQWPDSIVLSQQNNLNICVAGKDTLSKARSIFNEATTSSLTLTLLEDNEWQGKDVYCHIVYISKKTTSVSTLLQSIGNEPILTVGETEDFIKQGGIIGFVNKNNKVKLTINNQAARKAGLRIDPQLLEIAINVINS